MGVVLYVAQSNGLDKINLQDPLKGFRLWHKKLRGLDFKHSDGRSYHLSEIVDYSTKRKAPWYSKIFGGIQNTPYKMSGSLTFGGESSLYEISILDGNFTSSDNYRNNYVNAYSIGDADRQKFQNLYRVYWHSTSGHSVIFTFTSENYYNFFLGQ